MLSALRPRTLFIFDAVGSAASTLFLLLLYLRIDHVVGMPSERLLVLAILPATLLSYDLVCLFTRRADDTQFLFIRGLFNVSYCFVSIGYLFHHIEALTTLGRIYFIGEIFLLIGLAIVELHVAIRGEASRKNGFPPSSPNLSS